MATDVKKGQQYVVEGAIFKCQYGSAPCQIMAISNKMVTAQNKAIVTDKDVTFMLPSAPFVTCTNNPNKQAPMCAYANGIWNSQTTVQQGKLNAIVEKSTMKCPMFGGEISCVYPGQIQSVSAPELAEFKIETLSNFPLALVVIPPAKRQEDKGKKVSSVYSVSASKEYVRPNEVITLHAFDKGKKELKPTDIVNWAVTTRKKTEETVKGKTVNKECIDKLTLIKRVCTPFNISFQEPGIYYIEGGSDKMANKYSTLKTDQQLVVENGRKKPPFDENCKAVVEVLGKNRIIGIRLKGDYINGEDDDTIFLKNSTNLEIIVRTAVALESHEKLRLLINKHLTKEQAMPLPKYVAQVSNEYSFTLKPSFFNDNKKTVDITLSEETPYSFNFLPIGTFDTKSFTVKEVDSFVSAFVSLDKDGVNQIQKDSYLRPGTTIYLILRPTNKTDKNVDLSKAIWTIKEKYGNSIVRGGSNIHKLTFEGEVTISLDLSNCNTVINANDKGVTQASFSFNVSRNVIKGIVRTPKVFYPNIDYWINFDMLYKYDSFKDKEVSFFLDGNEIKAESDSYKVIFDKNQIGTHSIYYSEKGQFEFEVREASIEKWQFVDERHNKISEVGFDEPFYLEIKVPAWKDIKNEKVLDNVRIFLWDNNAKDPTPIKISALDDARFGKDGNAFIKLSISKQDIKVDGRKKINIIASLINPPYTDVVNLSKMKGYDSHWVCSKSSPLTLTTETCVTGFFSGKSGNPQKSVMKYGDSIFIMLATHNCKEITDRIKVELVENNKVGEKDDTVIAVYDNLEFGNNGKVKIDISEHFKNEDVHGDNPNPRLFYFGVKLDDAVIYTYPQSHEDVFNMIFKKKCEVTATKELQDTPSAEESEQKESECEESDTTVITQGEKNHLITKGEKSNDNGWNKKIRSYLWQLKVGKDKEIQRLNHSLTNIAPVVVGEELKKGEKVEKNTRCFCHRDFTVEEVKNFITALRGGKINDEIWELSPNVDDKSISTFTKELNIAFKRYGINKCIQKIVFLAMAYVETQAFMASEEQLNDYASSKSKFKGRGLLHLTKDKNYEKYNFRVSKNILETPELISDKIHNVVDSGATFFTNKCFMHNRVLQNDSKIVNKYIECFSVPYILTLSQLCLFMETVPSKEMEYYLLINRLLNCPTREIPLLWKERQNAYNTLKEAFKYKKEICKEVENDFPLHNKGWHDPLDVMQICAYSFNGHRKPYFASFHYRPGRAHQGVDLFAKINTPIYACLDGRIVYASTAGDYGNMIVLAIYEESQVQIFKSRRKENFTPYYSVEYTDGQDFNKDSNFYYLAYAHLSSFCVIEGDEVKTGDIIGYSGETGNAKGTKGPHVHFEVRDSQSPGGSTSHRCNPALYFDYEQYTPLSKDDKRVESETSFSKYDNKVKKIEIRHNDGNISEIEIKDFESDANEQYCYKKNKM